jgi:hypothetical protein
MPKHLKAYPIQGSETILRPVSPSCNAPDRNGAVFPEGSKPDWFKLVLLQSRGGAVSYCGRTVLVFVKEFYWIVS